MKLRMPLFVKSLSVCLSALIAIPPSVYSFSMVSPLPYEVPPPLSAPKEGAPQRVRYNNMGQVTDYFEEGTRSGGHFWEMVSMQCYDYLGRFFKNAIRSGTSNYTYTFDGTRDSTFYDSEGRVSSYLDNSGPVFTLVSNIQYDSYGRIVSYTQSVRGGATRNVFNIQYNEKGQIVSQQFTDSSMQLKFGDVNTQTFKYDDKGKMIETTIRNDDWEAVYDGDGNRKSFTLSAKMNAWIEEQKQKAIEEAKRQARAEAQKRARREQAELQKKLISRIETIQKMKKGGKVISDKEIMAAMRSSKALANLSRKVGIDAGALGKIISKAIDVHVNVKNIKVDLAHIERNIMIKILAEIKTKIKARAPNQVEFEEYIKKIVETYQITDKEGRVHTIRETIREDLDGNQIDRIVVDKFKLDKKTKATITSVYDSENKLVRLAERYEIKLKKNTTRILKFVSTSFDDNGNALDRVKVSDKIDRKASFSQILGATLTMGVLGGIWAGVDPNSFTDFMNSDFGKVLQIAALVAVSVMTGGNPFAVAAMQFSMSLASGSSFMDALISAGIAFAATAIATYIGPQISSFLGNLPGVGEALTFLKEGLSNIGKSLSSVFGATAEKAAEQTILQKFVSQFSLRVGSEVFSETFGKKVGVFGTVLTLAIAGTLASSLVSSAMGAPWTGSQFSNSFADSVFSGSMQGGIAEALKNEHGLGAQFLNQLGSNTAASMSLTGISKAFEVAKYFDPQTEVGQANLELAKALGDSDLKRPDRFFYNNDGLIEFVEYDIYGSTVRVGMKEFEGIAGTNSSPTRKLAFISNDEASRSALNSETAMKAAPSKEDYINKDPADNVTAYNRSAGEYRFKEDLFGRLDTAFIHNMDVSLTTEDYFRNASEGIDSRAGKILGAALGYLTGKSLPNADGLVRHLVGGQVSNVTEEYFKRDTEYVTLSKQDRAAIGEVYGKFKEVVGTAGHLGGNTVIEENPITAIEATRRMQMEANGNNLVKNIPGVDLANVLINSQKFDATQTEYRVEVQNTRVTKDIIGNSVYHNERSIFEFRTGLTTDGTYEVVEAKLEIGEEIYPGSKRFKPRESYMAPLFGDN